MFELLCGFHFNGYFTYCLFRIPFVGIGNDESGGIGTRFVVSVLIDAETGVCPLNRSTTVGFYAMRRQLLAYHPYIDIVILGFVDCYFSIRYDIFLRLEHHTVVADSEVVLYLGGAA